MDGSDNSLSSSTRPSATPKLSESDAGETNENSQNNHQMGSKLQNTKKTAKNFMSPTISAASKAVVPRKKILTERNEASESIFSDTQLQKTPNLDSKPLPANPGFDNSDVSSSSRVSEFDDDEQNTFVVDSSSQPYDPLTNYLSPRPKFLRYKPNRCREIFLGRENEIREGNDGLSVNRSVSFDSKKAIDEETSIGACGSSASSSQEGSVKDEDEENEENDEEIEEIEEERGWNLKGVLKTLLIFVVLVLSTLYISSMNSPTPSPALQAIWGLKDGYVKFQNHIFGAASLKSFEGGSEFLDQREETQMGLVEVNQRAIDEMAEDINMGVVENTGELGEAVVEIVEDENNDTVGEMGEVVELQAGESEDVSDNGIEITMEVSDQMGENIELQGIETAEKLEPLQDHHDMVSDIVNASDNEEDWVLIEEEEEVVEVMNPETEVNSMEELIEHTETESISKVVIGASLSFAIVVSLVLGFYLKRKKISADNSLPSVKPCSESVIVPNEGEEHIEKVDSFLNPSSLMEEEASKEFYESRAPTVELLGEFVVGEISSSLKSCRMKSRMMESEESNSVSYERSQNKARSVLNHAQLTLSEFSAMGSPSYGSFTAEENVFKKEEGRDGKVRKVVTTPVRRSGRIRNRTVMSP